MKTDMEKFVKSFAELFSRHAFAAVLCLIVAACISCSSDDEDEQLKSSVPAELAGNWTVVDDYSFDKSLGRVEFSRKARYTAYDKSGAVIVKGLSFTVEENRLTVYSDDLPLTRVYKPEGVYRILTFSIEGDSLFTSELDGCIMIHHKYLRSK